MGGRLGVLRLKTDWRALAQILHKGFSILLGINQGHIAH
ncbi:hypothetical protein RKLH11_1037 [Rhodobacteraceae bacterium KLH11]|nr:hypothetical protein RKLH11_1037 [Rhodobacteraceae bacterium KLH11]